MGWKQLGLAFDEKERKETTKLGLAASLKRKKRDPEIKYAKLAPGELDDDLDGIL